MNDLHHADRQALDLWDMQHNLRTVSSTRLPGKGQNVGLVQMTSQHDRAPAVLGAGTAIGQAGPRHIADREITFVN